MKKKTLLALLLIVLILGCERTLRPVSTVVHPSWSIDKTIYEANIRQFSEEGTFNAFKERLPELKELGVGIIWLMPVHPIGEVNRKGTLGSYYSVKDYLGINPEFGTMDDFKALVQAIHDQGMYVILDWVANHTAWDNPLVEQHPDWFTRDSLGNLVPPVPDWSDVVDLNYDNRELWRYMTDALKFWIEECDIDGYRCDVAEMVPIEFWEQAVAELNQIKPVFMLAEGEAAFLHQRAFNMSYSWRLFHAMNRIARGKAKAPLIDSLLMQEQRDYPPNALRMRFTSNHDENSWNGTVFERLGEAAKTMAVLTATIPGKPLLYSGQEAGLNKRLDFFEKDPIGWQESTFRLFYSKLFNLYQNNTALHKGSMEKISTAADDDVYFFLREFGGDKVLVVLNLSPQRRQVTVNSGHLQENYRELFSNISVLYDKEHIFDLEPWAYRVYVKEK